MKVLRATRESEIGSMLDYVHDRSYDLDRVRLNAEKGELCVPIYLGSRDCEGTLLVRTASRFELRDEAEIGEADINTISYADHLVVIDGALPVKISVQVDRLDLELCVPDDAPYA